MRSILAIADTRILLWLNHSLARHPRLYELALFCTDKGADIAMLATMAWLWFWPEFPADNTVPTERSTVTRQESRARLIVFAAAGMAAYVTARFIAFEVNVDRPFATYLPVHGVLGSFDGLRTFGSFPSDHAALLGALPLALFYWDRRVAWIWMSLAVLLSLVRVAVGFHYPTDMVAGAGLGLSFSATAMALFDRSASVQMMAIWLAAGFSRSPQKYVLYGLGSLVALEFAMHFRHVLGVLFALRSAMNGSA